METKYESISIPEFQKKYGTDEQCVQALIDLKWKDGFICPKCQGQKYCKAVRPHDRQCTRCRYVQSPTAGTLFHKVKFPLHLAFFIIYFVATGKKGITSTDVTRKSNLNQKTAWLFRIKILQAMESTNRHPLEGQVELMKTMFIKEDFDKDGKRKLGKKQTVIFLEKKSGGAARIYAKLLVDNSKKDFQKFVTAKIAKDARIKSCHWCTENFGELDKIFNSPDSVDKTGKEFKVMRRIEDRFKAWLSGVHGKVVYLQYYLNEYCYRHNRHRMKGEIFDDLLIRMVRHEPRPYSKLIA